MSRIQIKRGTAAAWTAANPILSPGEWGTETDTGKTKLGDGTATWNSLDYVLSSADLGQPNGVASLDADGKIPAAQLPGQVADVCLMSFGAETERAVGTGDNPFGMKLQRAVTFTSVTFRAATADASGNLVVELRKNGATVSGTSTTIAANSQVSGGTSTGSWAFAAGDILTVYVTAVGTTPGDGLIADVQGLTS